MKRSELLKILKKHGCKFIAHGGNHDIYTKLETKADNDLDNITDKGKQVIKETMQADMDKKANVDASNIDPLKWAEKLGTGSVAKGGVTRILSLAIQSIQQSADSKKTAWFSQMARR